MYEKIERNKDNEFAANGRKWCYCFFIFLNRNKVIFNTFTLARLPELLACIVKHLLTIPMMSDFPEIIENEWLLSCDKQKIDRAVVHHFLCYESYWAAGIPEETVSRSIAHAICLGVYLHDGRMVGFGRMITDRATFAYLCDIFVLKEQRGKGLGKRMIQYFCDLADTFGLRRFLLTTQDAHDLYRQSGFEPFPWPERLMSRQGVSYPKK